MWLVALVLLAGCQRLLDLQPVHVTDAGRAPDDGRAIGGDAPMDGPLSLRVQEVAAASNSSSLSVVLDTPPAANDVLIAIGGSEDGVKQLTGGGVVTWTLAASSKVSPTILIWFGVTDGSSSTVTLEANLGQIWLEVSEWRDLALENTLDAGSGAGASVIPGTMGDVNLAVTTKGAPDLLIFGIACYGTIGNPAASWMPLEGVASTFVTQDAWYELASMPGMQTAATMYMDDFDAALAAFRTTP